ncbi:hypothetical protein J2W35_000615 [Variovorax boronicumulans]|nr:hypothetical protein [Variovorax boronicumulans]MDQ0080285.1 hypothetical protein [Variovorax boronicumulans]
MEVAIDEVLGRRTDQSKQEAQALVVEFGCISQASGSVGTFVGIADG